ncbi:MAG: protein translocase subunit SecD, partial [Minisyncoccia bacterium]
IGGMWKSKIGSILLVVAALGVGWFVVASEPKLASFIDANENIKSVFPTSTVATLRTEYPFRLGLDLAGGSRLVFRADVSKTEPSEVNDAMAALRDVIDRRVNILGVSEPVVTTEKSFTGDEYRLVVELPGVTDLDKAAQAIGETPVLEFKTLKEDYDAIVAKNQTILETQAQTPQTVTIGDDGVATIDVNPQQGELVDPYITTSLGGRQLSKATLQFDPTTRQPIIALQFNEEGAKLFEEITGANIGKPVAIFLDNQPLSIPVVQQKITGGQAVITGEFTPQEARALVGRLNSGALPLKVELIGSQVVGATLGGDSVEKGVKAASYGFLLIALFLILWYRLPGVLAVIALSAYVAIMLAFFKLIPVVLTAAGIAGFIISMGLAVDANVLIFERMKEEMRAGKNIKEAVALGITRAWSSIRDSNTASLISAAILFWLGSSVVKGFALTLGLGVLTSLFTAIVITRLFLMGVAGKQNGRFARFLFSNGLNSGK